MIRGLNEPLFQRCQTVGNIVSIPILGGLHHQYVRVWVFGRDWVANEHVRIMGSDAARWRSLLPEGRMCRVAHQPLSAHFSTSTVSFCVSR
jgi:hypothetical protein